MLTVVFIFKTDRGGGGVMMFNFLKKTVYVKIVFHVHLLFSFIRQVLNPNQSRLDYKAYMAYLASQDLVV